MKKTAIGLGLVGIALVAALPEANALLDVYPAKGQSTEKQATDTAKCQQWAKAQTGFDPQTAMEMQQPAQQPAPALRPRKRAREEQQELAQESQQQKNMKQKLEAYDKAEATCLKGRGYSVSVG
jgi:hypothetical protein